MRATCLATLLACAGCERESSGLTIDMETLRRLDPETTAGITWEESYGTVMVTVIDRYGDGHMHHMIPGDATRAQVLEVLRQKQAELERRK